MERPVVSSSEVGELLLERQRHLRDIGLCIGSTGLLEDIGCITVHLEVAGGAVAYTFASGVLDVGLVLLEELALGRLGFVALQDLRAPPNALEHLEEAIDH